MAYRISKVNVVDFLGLASVNIAPKKPIVLVSGGNAAGKSSLYQAIRLALFDELPRVDLKKEAPALVRDGASRATISVVLTDGEEGMGFAYSIPARVREGGFPEAIDPTMLDLCLDPTAFVLMAPEDRVKLMIRASGVSMDPAVIADRLTARGIPAPIVAEIQPMLRMGFERCVVLANEQASQARGAWKQLTGEVYGSVKATTWKPPQPGELPLAPVAHGEAVRKHAEASAEVAKLEGLRSTYLAELNRRAKDRDTAATAEALRDKVAKAMTAANGEVEPATQECPACGTDLILVDGKLHVHVKKPQPYVSAAAKARGAAELSAAKRDLQAAEAAAARIAAETDLENPTDEAIQKARDAINDASATLTSLSADHERYAAAVAAKERSEEVASKATARHNEVEAWTGVADALSPSGIPSELADQCMAPLRRALALVSKSSGIEHWALPAVSNTGQIFANRRPVAMLSESEQYRVCIVLAAAIAVMSGMGVIAMDRADVLSPGERGNMLAWLMDLCAPTSGKPLLEQAWIFATTKAAMTGLEDGDPIEEHRLLGGVTE